MSAPPKPLFVIFGIDSGATCCHVTLDRLFVGSQSGTVGVYGVETKVLEETAYVDPDQRRIQSIDSDSDDLFIQIRAFAILRLHRIQKNQWEIRNRVETDHVGFCNSLLLDGRLLTVSNNKERVPVMCWTDKGGDKLTNQSIIGDSAADVMPMYMTRGEEDEVLIGMEDGRLAVFKDSEGFECHEMIKLGREPIFCVASCSKWIAAGCARAPIYLLERKDQGEVREVGYPPNSAGCSAITFSPNQKQILAGFWDGSIRVFSCLRLSCLLALSSQHSASITSLHWRRPEDGEELVIATSSDGTVSMWKLR